MNRDLTFRSSFWWSWTWTGNQRVSESGNPTSSSVECAHVNLVCIDTATQTLQGVHIRWGAYKRIHQRWVPGLVRFTATLSATIACVAVPPEHVEGSFQKLGWQTRAPLRDGGLGFLAQLVLMCIDREASPNLSHFWCSYIVETVLLDTSKIAVFERNLLFQTLNLRVHSSNLRPYSSETSLCCPP